MNNVLIPAGQEIDDTLAEIGVEGTQSAVERFQGLYDELFTSTRIYGTSHYSTTMAEDINSILEEAKQEVQPKAKETGQYIGAGIAEGMSNYDFTEATISLVDSAVELFNAYAGINSPAEIMKPSGKYLTLGVIEGFKNEFGSFTEPIGQLCDLITSKLSNGLQNVKNVWTNIWNSLPSTVTNVINSISNKISGFVSNISSAFSRISNSMKGIGSGLSNIGFSGSSTTKIKGYASGGFVDSASIFMAGENGVPEMLGTVGGKTAVAGGAEITGIADAVYNTGQTEAALLQTAVSLLQVIANKDFGITDGEIFDSVRKSENENYKRTGKHVLA